MNEVRAYTPNELQVYTCIEAATPSTIKKINDLHAIVHKMEQTPHVIEHMIHGGMYTRSTRLPRNTLCTAVLIEPATVLITVGELDIWTNDEVTHVIGYNVIPGCAKRKIAFVTYSEVCMSMVFPTTAKTVAEAQRQFSTEHHMLPPLAAIGKHRTLITGE